MIQVVPASVGAASRAWDEQHLDLAAASGEVAVAPGGGFSTSVAGSASRFRAAWEGLLDDVADSCEGRADALRKAIRIYMDSDESSVLHDAWLLGYLEERR